MACQDCGEDADLTSVKVGSKSLQLCEECAEVRHEQAEIAGEAESAMKGMMEYKGS